MLNENGFNLGEFNLPYTHSILLISLQNRVLRELNPTMQSKVAPFASEGIIVRVGCSLIAPDAPMA